MANEKELKSRIQHKHDTEANWNKATNFIPKAAELIVYDKDTTHPWMRLKIGDGSTTVVNLPFAYNGKPSVTFYGAIATDYNSTPSSTIIANNTAAFKKALSENREVYVPGGTFFLNDTLVIEGNSGLELSQDTILYFKQTDKPCIEMRRLASIDGHHALIKVDQAYKSQVIDIDTELDGKANNHAIPPFTKSDPMWKSARTIKDIHIVKMNSNNFCAPQCSTYKTEADKQNAFSQISGTAIHMITKHLSDRSWDIWTADVSGVRIAGAFSYGINIENDDGSGTTGVPANEADPAWNHDMRLEASILGAETGARLYNCNTAHLRLTIEPSSAVSIYDSTGEVAERGIPYAKNGIILEYCKNVDIVESVVWDWYNEGGTLYDPTDDVKKTYTHIALIGNCQGLTLSDMLYTEKSSRVADVRDLIYTDYPKNWEKISITQEPVTRWFTPIDEEITYNNGNLKRYEKIPYFRITEALKSRLLLKEEFDNAIQINNVNINYVNVAENNYLLDGRLSSSTGEIVEETGDPSRGYYIIIDFIPFTKNDTLYFKNLTMPLDWSECKINFYDSGKNPITNSYGAISRVFGSNTMANEWDFVYKVHDSAYELISLKLKDSQKNASTWQNVAYARINIPKSTNPYPENIIIATSPIEKQAEGSLASGITVSKDQIRDFDFQDTGATSITTTGDGNAVTSASYDASTRKITLTKGSTFNNYKHPVGGAPSKTSSLYKFSTDASSHINDVTAVIKSDITALGIPGSDTTYSAGTGLTLSGTTINHTNAVTAKTNKNQETAAPGYGGTFKVTEPLYDATGHITGINTATITMPSAQTIPSTLKNPYSLSINDTVYDGSKAVTVDTRGFIFTATGNSENGYTINTTYDAIFMHLAQGRSVNCLFNGEMFVGFLLPLLMVNSENETIAFGGSPFSGAAVTLIIARDGSVEGDEIFSDIQIGEQFYDFYGSVDFTDTINGMISNKIPSALKNPNALTINDIIYDGSEAVEVDTREFAVTMTPIEGMDMMYSADKTFAELLEAHENGRTLVCWTEIDGALIKFNLNGIQYDDDSAQIITFVNTASRILVAYITSDDFAMVSEGIHFPVKNPYALTVNGTAYDGSAAVTMNLAKKEQGIFYITGDSTTAGVWTGTCEEITEYFEGLTIAYKTNVAGVSGGSTLNINNLGAIPVKRNASTAVTTTYPVGSIIILTYSGGNWLTADYDANTKNTAGSSNKAATKLFLTGATSQTSSGTTTYSNKDCYIGTDNCLYSEGKKTVTVDDSLKNPNSFIINGTAYDGSKEIEFNAMPLAGTLLNHTFVVSALSDAKTHRTLMSLGEQNAFLFQVTNLETEAQQFFTMNEQGSYLTNLRVDEPINDNNAATKKYVDDKIGQIEFGLY